MVVKNKSKTQGKSKLKMFLWGLLALILNVVGIAFLVQGFVMQLATGVLYYGMLHFALGLILVGFGWAICCKNHYCHC